MSSSTIGRDEVLREAEALGADLAALRANLALSPAERIAELAVMNRLHAAVQARTVPAALRAALARREMEAALQQLADREA